MAEEIDFVNFFDLYRCFMSGFIIDIQGIIFKGDEFIPEAKQFMDHLNSEKKQVYLLSNSTRITTKQTINQLKSAGIEIQDSNVITGSKIIVNAMKQENIKHILLLGTDDLCNEVAESGIAVDKGNSLGSAHAEAYKLNDKVEAVVVAEDLSFNFVHASIVARYVLEKKVKFFCVGYDRVFPSKGDNFVPGALTLATPS